MIGKLAGIGAVRRRMLCSVLPLLLTLPRRVNFRQMAGHGERNEGTYHNWHSKPLDLARFNRSLVEGHGSGEHFTIFDPSFLPKSGKGTPGVGRFWSGQAGAVKRGMEVGCLAVGDLGHRTAFHLDATPTPSPAELREAGLTLVRHYVSVVERHAVDIRGFGNCLTADGYFGVGTFVGPVTAMGICVVSCLKANAALFYAPAPANGKRGRGRPRVKDGRPDWSNPDEGHMPVVRSGPAYVKCLRRTVRLVAVDYLKEDGSLTARKPDFCTDAERGHGWVLERYHGRYWIEFLFRDSKQFAGLAHCQSTDAAKLEDHVNLSLTAVSAAKAAHWLPLPAEERGPFSMAELKSYYYNLAMVERFSEALGIDPTETKNNPKIKELLFSKEYTALAA